MKTIILKNKFCIILMLQVLALFLYNLTMLHMESNYDSSAAYAQAMEIWNQKTFFIQDWAYQSTGGLDSILPLAALFYGITGNIFVSYGIADCMGTLLFLYVVMDLGKNLGFHKDTSLLLCIFSLTPFTLGQLGYLPMMFTGAAYYMLKVLLPLLLIDNLFRMHKKQPSIPLLCIYFWLLFFTGFSCGLYLLACGIAPIFLWELWIRRDKKTAYLGILSCITMFLGIITSKLYGLPSFTDRMVLCTASNFIDNLKRWFIGFFELFGAVPYEAISVTSPQGILYVLRMGIVATLLILFGTGLVHLMKNNADMDSIKMGYFLSVVIMNTIILLLCYTTYGSDTYEYRYHLIPAFCILFIAAYSLEKMQPAMKKLTYTCGLLALLLVNIAGFCQCYMVRSNYNQCAAIMEQLEKDQIHLAYFIDETVSSTIDARNARLLSSEVQVVSGSSFGDFHGWGASTRYYHEEIFTDSTSTDKIAYILTTASYENLPANLKETLRLQYQNGDYFIYYESTFFQ